MKEITTLVKDIYSLLDQPNLHMEFDVTREAKLGARMIQHIRDEVRDPDRADRPLNERYVTQFTGNCMRKIWYNLYGQISAEPVPKEKISGDNKFKFLYGDLIEESVLYLAELAGHDVTMQQERLSTKVDDFIVSGRIDAIIDGILVDVKSMDTYSFAKLQAGTYEDKFGYYDQLGIYKYMLETKHPPTVIHEAGILGVNKQNGRIVYSPVPNEAMDKSPAVMFDVVRNPDIYFETPNRQVTNKSGNTCLSAGCAYCPYKFSCYEEEGGLTVYAYSEGPTFIVGKHKIPKVPDITQAYVTEVFGS